MKAVEVLLTLYNDNGTMEDMCRFFVKCKFNVPDICNEIEDLQPEAKKVNYSFIATKDHHAALHFLKLNAGVKSAFVNIINNGVESFLNDILIPNQTRHNS